MTNMLNIITKVNAFGKTFVIAKNDEGYWAINSKNIDESGKLTVQLNGISGFLSETAKECIERCLMAAEVEHLVNSGMEQFEAVLTAYNHVHANA